MSLDHRFAVAKAVRVLLTRIPELALALLVGVLVLFLTGSVTARYVANIGIGWSDEAAELIFMWIVLLGFALATRRRANVGIDLLVDRLPHSWRRPIEILQDAIVLIFSFVFTKESAITMHFAVLQRFPGLQISIGWLYAATLVGGVLMTVYAAANLWETVRGRRSNEDFSVDNESRYTE